MILDTRKLDRLEEEIVRCGAWAVEEQSKLIVSYKEDKSLVTQVDLGISSRICALLKELFPECGIISEEELVDSAENPPYTFVLDPIDGTDVFSQGLPSFAIALGIMDKDLEPVGAIINAPRFGVATDKGMLLRLDPGKELLLNGRPFKKPQDKDTVRQISISSKNLKALDFTSYTGKVRCFGSTIIHTLCPVMFPLIQGTVAEPCYIWDYAAAHAVLRWAGMDLIRWDGGKLSYREELKERKRCSSSLVGGTPKACDYLRKTLNLG